MSTVVRIEMPAEAAARLADPEVQAKLKAALDAEGIPLLGIEPVENEIEKRITTIFHGITPRCQACGERSESVGWRPAYQMLLCPGCPK